MRSPLRGEERSDDETGASRPRDRRDDAYADSTDEFYEHLLWGWLLRPANPRDLEPNPLVISSWPPPWEPLRPGLYSVLLIDSENASEDVKQFVDELPPGMPLLPCGDEAGILVCYGVDETTATRMVDAFEARGARAAMSLRWNASSPEIEFPFVDPPPHWSEYQKWFEPGTVLQYGDAKVLLLGVLTEDVSMEVYDLVKKLCRRSIQVVADDIYFASAGDLQRMLESHGGLVDVVFNSKPDPTQSARPASALVPPEVMPEMLDEEQLRLDVVVACVAKSATGTLQDILSQYAAITSASRVDPYSASAQETERRFGVTPQQYGDLQEQMDAENIEEMARLLPQYLATLTMQGLVSRSGLSYRLTPSGISYYGQRFPAERL